MKQALGIFVLFLWSLSAVAQKSNVTGKVTDASDGSPIPGVSVVVKGTTTGSITNLDGEYQLDAKIGDALVFSFIGMKSVEVVATDAPLVVKMQSETTDLDDVVVVGYGVQKKALVTGANLNIKGEDIAKFAPTSPMDALKGISPGVSITSTSGAPGADTKVLIRGIGTMGNAKPLFIVDGVNADNIDHLSPSDIATIDVLKDAASAAIYGSRGANGVILVTTKKGKVGSPTVVTYDGYYGVQNVAKSPNMLNAQEYMTIIDEARVNDGLAGENWKSAINNDKLYDSYLDGSNKGTNWTDEMVKKNAVQQNHSIGVSGGSQDIAYAFGASYFQQEGVVGGNIIDAGITKLSLRQNTEFTLFKNDKFDIVKVGTTTVYTQKKNKQVAAGNMYYNDYRNALTTHPLMSVKDSLTTDPNGYTRAGSFAPGQANPIARMYYERNFAEPIDNRIYASAYLQIQPVKNLILKSQYGIDNYFGNNRTYSPVRSLGGSSPATAEDNVNMSMYSGVNSTWTTTLAYDLKINEVHNVTAVIGNELLQNETNINVGGNKSNSLFGDWEHAYLDNVPKQKIDWINVNGFNSAAQGGATLSYFGRINYDFKQRYMLAVTLRADGSSKFAEGERWGRFPSASAGWILTEESFADGLENVIDYCKLRASWGQVGNQAVPSFLYNSNISTFNSYYYFGGDKGAALTGAYPAKVPSKGIKWETSETIDFGLDARFLASRLNLNLDWYQKSTIDWLVTPPSAGVLGAPAGDNNNGSVKNTGVELSLGWNDNISDFSYGIVGSLTYNKNEVTSLNSTDGIFHGPSSTLAQGMDEIYRAEVGKPIGYFWGYQTEGILQNEVEAAAYRAKFVNDKALSKFTPGDVKFVDKNGDGVLNSDDKGEIGNPNPDFIVGMQLNLGYKNVYINATFNGQFGGQNMRTYRSFTDNPLQNYTTDALARWHGEGTSDKLPRLSMSPNESQRYVSDIYVESSDFVRLNNLTLGYKFTNMVKKSGFMKDARVYIQAQNLLTLTKYKGLNPEVGYGNDSWASGVDLGLYPATKTYMVGVNLTF